MSLATYHVGLETLDQEITSTNLPLQGKLPSWLTGTLLRTGPAKFEVGKESYHHWFDGLAMLYQFSFADNEISYTNRFLQSGSYRDALEIGQISRSEFGTYPQRSLLVQLLTLFSGLPSSDNGNVNITAIADQIVAVTETPSPVAFCPTTLQTIGDFEYTDDLPGQTTTAHPHFDFKRNQTISYQIQFGRQSNYIIYSIDAGTKQRRFLAKIPVEKPAYMHSFPISERYVILVECPLVVNPLKLATIHLHKTPFIENYHWHPEQGTRFHIIDREDGSLVNTCEGEPFFAFHYVNAFERDENLVIDASSYPDVSVIDGFYLKNLRSGTEMILKSQLTRYYVPLQGKKVKSEVLSNAMVEFPRINYKRCNGLDYRIVYGGNSKQSDNFIDQLVKVDVQTGTTISWQQQDCYPGEPVFVAAPNSEAEDEGVILSLVLDGSQRKTFLLVLEAQSFEEIARAEVPHVIPFGLHGQFFEDVTKPLSNRHLHR
jgi:carotenoid cleavage dioxygenase-like enzyme